MKSSRASHKLFKAALATTVATGAFVMVVPANANADTISYKDISAANQHYENVMNLSKRGILHGYPDGNFKPGISVTRAQAAKIIALSLGLETKNVTNPGFTDVSTKHGHYGAIAALVKAGIVNGYDDKTFKPNNPLTRSQMAKIINIGFDLEAEVLTDNRFKDIKKTDAYAGYVQALLTNKITTGTTPTTYSPNALVTRGQMASFIVRTETAKAKEAFKAKIVAAAGEQQNSAFLKYFNLIGQTYNFGTSTDDVAGLLESINGSGFFAELKSLGIKTVKFNGAPVVIDYNNLEVTKRELLKVLIAENVLELKPTVTFVNDNGLELAFKHKQ